MLQYGNTIPFKILYILKRDARFILKDKNYKKICYAFHFNDSVNLIYLKRNISIL
jgi:hypothetical protein